MLKSLINKLENYNILNLNIFLIFFLILIFMPKINLVPIPGYWQGIRIEDIILLLYLLFLIKNNKTIVISENFLFHNFLIFFLYALIVNYLAILLKLQNHFILILRFIEYIILIIFINNFEIKRRNLLNILKFFLLINFLFVLLQKFQFIGSWSSLGYLNANNVLNSRAFGILGGSWELALTASLAYFSLYFLSNKLSEKVIYFFLTLVLIILSMSRTPLFAFIISMCAILLFNKNNLKKLSNLRFDLKIITKTLFFFIIFYIFLNVNEFDSLKLNLSIIVKMILNFSFYNIYPEVADMIYYDQKYWSLIYRFKLWSGVASINENYWWSYLIGSGFTHVYTDSIYIRLLLNFGLVGFFLILFLIKKTPISILIFFIITGITLDVFSSMKIFLFTLILFMSYRLYATNSR